jgi:putative Holliday junction resolvase
VNRILGLDAGERRIGVAISDPDRRFALPLRSIDAAGGEEAIARIVEAEEVTEIVVGLPLSLSGEAGAQTERARAFGRGLEERLGLPVQFWDERLSTQEAMRLGGSDRGGRGRERRTRRVPMDTDSIAASVVLQAFLDRMRYERDS